MAGRGTRCEGVRSGGATGIMTPPRRRGSETLNADERNRYHLSMVGPITRVRSAHDVGDAWTAADAAELDEIARWGEGYFSIGENGQVKVHPTKNPSRSIISNSWSTICSGVGSVSRRSSDFATSSRIGFKIFTGPSRAPSRSTSTGRLHLCVPHQGQPAAPGRRRVPGIRTAVQFGLEAGSKPELLAVWLGRQPDADHLQRLQRCGVRRDGHAGSEDGPANHPGGRKVHRTGSDSRSTRRSGGRPAHDRHAGQARRSRRWALEVVRWLRSKFGPYGRSDAVRSRS